MRIVPIIACCCVFGLLACEGEVGDAAMTGTPDTGTHESLLPDAAMPLSDAGTLSDSGTPTTGVDSGTDAGPSPVDAGDAGEHVDPNDDAAIDAGPPSDGGPIVSEGPAEVRFVGRVDRSDASSARFAWSGTGVVARFIGTSVAVDLGGGQEYTVLIDGVLRPKLVPANGDTLIADDLSADAHLIELYRRTEANQGESQFRGFTFANGGELLPPTLAPSRRIEVIGDSITCGYGNEGADETCPFTPQTENHYQTYAAIAARALDAELSTIAWSGRGMVCNYGDDANSCSMPLPSFYDRTLPDHGDSQWDFSASQPQAVIINLGTNDYSTDSDPSEGQFTGAYTDFLMHVRSKYPNALILCTCGPLLWGEELDMVRMFIENAVDATGDDNIDTFEIPSQSADDGLGRGWHPSITTHEHMADVLIEQLESRLGW